MLTIQNVQNIIGRVYSPHLDIIGVKEHTLSYEFTLGGTLGSNQIETIWLHRNQTDSGHYIMEYNSKTLWLTKNEFDAIDKIIVCMQTI